MLVLIVGGIAYVIIRDIPLSNANLYETFVIKVIFLVAPFIGGCSAFRLATSANSSIQIIGWLLVVIFALFFLQATLIDWIQYRNYHGLLRR
jgi:hypothetical protein